jgi:ATP-dependent DNA helicase RecG
MSGRDSYDTIESHDITGCIPKQSMRVVSLLEEWLGINYEVKGSHLKHSELKLPLIAIREAVNNALFHRQYSIQGPIKIALFSNRLEIFSPGHFSGPFIPETLGDGTSYIRNSVLSQTARRLNLIEKRGTGIKLIIESVRDYGLPQPVFEEGSHWFKVSLFFIKNQQSGITNQEMAIMALFETKEKLKSADVCQELNVSKATGVAFLDKLIQKNRIVRQGKGPKTCYVKVD